MSGSPRDLAVADHWRASLERSRSRRARAGRGLLRRPAVSAAPSPLLAEQRLRDLADEEPWELSLGRSRARRRAAELQFVPGGSRAKRISIGTLAALTVGPATGMASGGPPSSAPSPEPATTTEHTIVLMFGSEGRQVRLLQAALGGIKVDGIFGPETEEAVRSFQSSHSLAVDGIAGPLTTAALNGRSNTSFAADINSSIPGEGADERRRTPGIAGSGSAKTSDAVNRHEGQADGRRPDRKRKARRRAKVRARRRNHPTRRPVRARSSDSSTPCGFPSTANSGLKPRMRCAACRLATDSTWTASWGRKPGPWSASTEPKHSPRRRQPCPSPTTITTTCTRRPAKKHPRAPKGPAAAKAGRAAMRSRACSTRSRSPRTVNSAPPRRPRSCVCSPATASTQTAWSVRKRGRS